MSPATLPYAVLLLVAEFAIGMQIALYVLNARGEAPHGLIRLGAGMVAVSSALAVWLSLLVPKAASVDGYSLETHFLDPARAHLALLLAFSLIYAITVWQRRRWAELATGGCGSVAALLALFALSALVQEPTSSWAGTFLSMLAGGLALGGVTLSMSLGHWYLVTPRLPSRPLNEMTLALLLVILLQTLLLAVDVALPGRHPIATLPLIQNPAFWLRIGVGLLLAGLFAFMAWQSSRMRGMMSATGLLYLATGAVLAGQALACALLFSTAIPG